RPLYLSICRRRPRPGLDGAETQRPSDHRQPHPERRALPLAATGCLDAASVQLDQLPHDREPDAETPVRASTRAVGLPEALEQLGQERRGDALAAIRARQLVVRSRARLSSLDPAPR